VLKGSGHHQYVAKVAAGGAVANLLLSIPFVKSWGPVGAAVGMAIPTVVMCTVFIFPRACHVVGLAVSSGYRQVVWPALWPALVTVTLLVGARPLLPPGVMAVLLQLAAGAGLYIALFFSFGLSSQERRWIRSAVLHVWRRRSDALAAA
jgi:O-antigen/teichoic acid export membrane protein